MSVSRTCASGISYYLVLLVLIKIFPGCSNQQDVSEFTHKLLDWLEEAFNVKSVETKSTNCDIVKSDSMEEGEPMDSESEKMDKEKESEEKPTGSSSSGNVNQMNSLFYGQVKKISCQISSFTAHRIKIVKMYFHPFYVMMRYTQLTTYKLF